MYDTICISNSVKICWNNFDYNAKTLFRNYEKLHLFKVISFVPEEVGVPRLMLYSRFIYIFKYFTKYLNILVFGEIFDFMMPVIKKKKKRRRRKKHEPFLFLEYINKILRQILQLFFVC